MAEDSLTVSNNLAEIRGLAKFSGLFCDANGLQSLEHRLTLVLEEFFTNVVTYGYDDNAEHEIDIRFKFDKGVLTAIMEDDGHVFDPRSAELPDMKGSVEERSVDGLGLHLIFAIVDSFDYQRAGELNRATMTFKVPARKK